MVAAFIVGFLVSFENFNTTLMLVGSDAPLTITMYDRMVKVGATPVLNAVSVFLMLGSGLLALRLDPGAAAAKGGLTPAGIGYRVEA